MVTGKEYAGVGNSSELTVLVGFARKANTAKVAIQANKNPSSVQSRTVWVLQQGGSNRQTGTI